MIYKIVSTHPIYCLFGIMSHQTYIYAIYKQLQIYYRHKGRVVWWVWGLRWGGREEKERERKRERRERERERQRARERESERERERESEREHLREHL
jgi:hypothetical protein